MATKKAPVNNPYIIRHGFEEEQLSRLVKSGAPRSAFMQANGSLDLISNIHPFQCDPQGVSTRKMSAKRQLEYWDAIVADPLSLSAPLFIISAFPSDTRALNCGLYLMARGMNEYFTNRQQGRQTFSNKESPYWHRVMGGYNDRDQIPREKRPAMLLLSNVIDSSSAGKYEKLRDILVQYEDVPRIVMTSAADPLTFSLEWLRLSPDGVMFLGPNDSTRNQSL